MASHVEHYEALLAPVYSWMIGGLPAATARAADQLQGWRVPMGPEVRVIDLGAGPGTHVLPLLENGCTVQAVDTSAPLLAELREHAPTTGNLETITGDLVEHIGQVRDTVDVVLCLGDTLTHLASVDQVEQLLKGVARVLRTGGVLLTSFRDLTGDPAGADRRFLLVRGDEQRILTCYLEHYPDHVRVHDIVHELGTAGWSMRVGAYDKLRLSPARVEQLMGCLGLSVERIDAGPGLVGLRATKR